ncbi:type II toxin-antitoxin system RelE family toxin [Xenorhabdus eapokensis]|uniref:RelE-like toxin protein n=1 Tax=Xenorhabdus eapokensis TaxID=1873482 RepID=A0A1Q5TX88_9GAMM|nr:type II toxin-antitoxin system RelE/ParE family toxin [Xenorhabdus eapokensis]OKP04836.1 RelE-like toxin protein [Xenorhabdus eapokensis]OKP05221.1 RelE-like toxin protein [Xenorhabdus eapokensis]
MIYAVKFREDAAKEWARLDSTIQRQFAKKLKKLCENPHIPSLKLSGMPNCYKVKLRASGFRLVYQVIDDKLIIAVVAVGKRERNEVYRLAINRISEP